ncbi:hypothetical protein C8Q76DRAFT_696811 [Earliella scabrosa]|nr:hypothetical protein C8Q76DRAFT_696811 [Earliella scabrosa]
MLWVGILRAPTPPSTTTPRLLQMDTVSTTPPTLPPHDELANNEADANMSPNTASEENIQQQRSADFAVQDQLQTNQEASQEGQRKTAKRMDQLAEDLDTLKKKSLDIESKLQSARARLQVALEAKKVRTSMAPGNLESRD